MSVLYCVVPHFVAGVARREDAALVERPLVVVGPAGRVLGVSAEVAVNGVAVGMTAREAEVRCPEARLLEADVARCRAASEVLWQVLEGASDRVEPHGWGAAYVDLPVLAASPGGELKARADAIALLRHLGRAVRAEMGDVLQPALGWDSGKFTAQAAARRTAPGRLRAVDRPRQREFLGPLPVTLLPLANDTVQRLGFLGLRTLGQYAALPRAAVGQQFGRAGLLAQRCARGEDDRPVVPRWQSAQLSAEVAFETPLAERARLVAALEHAVAPLLAELRANFQACGRVRLTVHFDDGTAQERARAFLQPVSAQGRVVRALGGLLDRVGWPAPARGLAVTLAQVQEAVAEQLTLFPLQDEGETKLQEVQRYLAARFGVNTLRRAVLARPGAPLPEWRVGWLDEGAP